MRLSYIGQTPARIPPKYPAMPFRHIPPRQFSANLLKLMQAAYDSISAKLHIDSTSDPRSAELASIIIDLAANGERQNLAARALEAAHKLGQPKAKRRSRFRLDEQPKA